MKKGQVFKYDKQVWIVIGPGVYGGFYRCMNPHGEIRQFNKDVGTIIGKHLESNCPL